MKLLLHSCCAPCSVECAAALAEEGITPDLFWYNPNIHPFTEYRSRKESLESFARDKNLLLVMEDEYGLRAFIRGVAALEDFSEDNNLSTGWRGISRLRCAYCYRLRLEKTAQIAQKNGYDTFSTTLLISPWQNHELVKSIGEDLAASCGIAFLYRDFRPLYQKSRAEAKEAGYYMQKYCGCIFSEEERYLK